MKIKSGEVCKWIPECASVSIEGVRGLLWVTQAGVASDFLLGPGTHVQLEPGRLTVLEALRDSEFETVIAKLAS